MYSFIIHFGGKKYEKTGLEYDDHAAYAGTRSEGSACNYPCIMMDGVVAPIVLYRSDQHQIGICRIAKIFTVAIFRILKLVAAIKRKFVNSSNAVRNGYAGQTDTPPKRRQTDGCNIIRDDYAGQAAATHEHTCANGGNAVSDRHAGQIVAVFERRYADGDNTIRDGNTGQAGTRSEG